jgi:hypothetical protein
LIPAAVNLDQAIISVNLSFLDVGKGGSTLYRANGSFALFSVHVWGYLFTLGRSLYQAHTSLFFLLVILRVLVIMTIDDDMSALTGFICEAFFYGSFIASTGARQIDCSFPL